MTVLSASLGLPECDSRAAARPRATLWLIVLIALAVLSAGLGRLVYLLRPLDNDAAMFIYMGKLVANGDRYWDELRDNKFPSVGLVISLFWRAFGANWPAYVLTQMVMAVASAHLLARSAARHICQEAWWPTFLGAIVFLNLNLAVFGGFQLETLQSFFCILAFCAGLEALSGDRWIDSFVVGLCAGFAALLKPTGLGVAGVIWLGLMLPDRSWRNRIGHTLAMVVGAMVPIGAFFIYLWQTNLLPIIPEIFHETARYASETPWRWTDLLKPGIVLVIVGFPVVVRGWVFRRDMQNPHPSPLPEYRARGQEGARVFWLAALWFAVEMLGAVMQRRMYAYHFYPVLPPVVIMFGFFPRKDSPARLLAALSPIMLLSILGAREVIENGEPPVLPATAFIKQHTSSNDRIWVDCGMRLALETDRRLGSRFPLMFLFSNYDDAPQKYGEILLNDLATRRPKYVLLPGHLDQRLSIETHGWDQLVRSPARRDNYVRAWGDVTTFVKDRYDFVDWIGNEHVFVIKNR